MTNIYDFHGKYGDVVSIQLLHILKEFKESKSIFEILIIVGKGSGRLKQIVSSHLEQEKEFTYYYDEYRATFIVQKNKNFNYVDIDIDEEFQEYFEKLKN
ncbi:Smr/MutS family protein [[Mycoplasma] collis]|uniref:Smr/MutS family protein n=1 Tax=[Mycoplasma] collis TaxID=2127 RepID=UPI00051C3E69|nr:Smr/MutS family protein [[Mycoplasma] collis]